MTLGQNYRIFKLITGEIVITETETNDEGMYSLSYPAIIIPIPPNQAQGQQNQIGFGKMMPFSDYGEDIILNPSSIVVDTSPDKRIIEAYESWRQQIKSLESGIIVPNMQAPKDVMPTKGQARDFRNLNVGG